MKYTRTHNLRHRFKGGICVLTSVRDYRFLYESGLDSKSAKQCVRILKDLASEGRTVVCSIHQPSMSLLDLFDNVYMLTDGVCIYQGTVPNIIPYLKANGLECPMYHNPIEFSE